MTIEESINQTGRRFFKATAEAHALITPQLDANRGLPKDLQTAAPTLRAIQTADELPVYDELDEAGELVQSWLLFSIEVESILQTDVDALVPLLIAGSVVEITVNDHQEAVDPPT